MSSDVKTMPGEEPTSIPFGQSRWMRWLMADVLTLEEGNKRQVFTRLREGPMTNIHAETGELTGTRDRTYDLIWYAEACLKNALRLENFIADAEREGDEETATLFRKAQADSRKGAEQAKILLKSRLD
jgi:hypothetical protein